ncbi:unnamed protein product [Pylaiella littoralis]
MKVTGIAAVMGVVASTQAFHVSVRTKLGAVAPARTGSTSLNAISDAEAAASLEAIGGYDVETMNKPLDPLNLAKYIPAEKLRKYETVHCRVAMLACVGYAFPQIFGMFDATDVTSANGIDAILQTSPEALAQIVGACGIAEAAQWRHEQSGATTTEGRPCSAGPRSFPLPSSRDPCPTFASPFRSTRFTFDLDLYDPLSFDSRRAVLCMINVITHDGSC